MVRGDEAEAPRGDLVNSLRVQVLRGVPRCGGEAVRVSRVGQAVAREGASVRNLRANSYAKSVLSSCSTRALCESALGMAIML